MLPLMVALALSAAPAEDATNPVTHAGHDLQREEPEPVIGAARSVVNGASQMLCAPTPSVPIRPGSSGSGRGTDPVWVVADGGSAGNLPNKMLWIFHTHEHVRIEGRELISGRSTRFQIGGGDTPMLDAIDLDDPRRVTVFPGGSAAEVRNGYFFVPSYVYFPQPGCFEFTIQLEHATQRIVIEAK
jgi:hypothetical protein